MERCGVEDAQTFSAGDLIELANFIDDADTHRSQIERIRTLAATWAVDDDTYLSLDGQDLGYADAALQISAIIDSPARETTRPTTEQITEVLDRLAGACGWIGEGEDIVKDLLAWINGENTDIADWALSLCPQCGKRDGHLHWCPTLKTETPQ